MAVNRAALTLGPRVSWIALVLALGLLLQLSPVHAQNTAGLRIGINPAFPPFSYVDDDGDLRGFDVDFALALCESLQQSCKLVQLNWVDLLPSLLERQVDAIVASMSITDERREIVAFTDRYYTSPARFIGRSDSASGPFPGSVLGKIVGVLRNSTADRYLGGELDAQVAVRRYTYLDEVLLDLSLGRVDLVLGDEYALRETFLERPEGVGYEFVGPSLVEPKWFGYGIGIAVRKDDDGLRQQLNAAIAQSRNNGTYLQLQDRYFGYDIYGEGLAQQR